MDFDDLDDAINQRLAEGGTLEGAAGLLAASAHTLKDYKPTAYMPPMPRDGNKLVSLAELPATAKRGLKEPVPREACIRMFVFCGEGESAESFAKLLGHAPATVDVVGYEWPGHGHRAGETSCRTLDALADDAMDAVKPAIQEHAAGGILEGAPFVLVGSASGALLVAALGKKLRALGLEPSAVVVIDRAPPHMPLLSPAGLQTLKDSQEEFVKAYRPEASYLPQESLRAWLDDLRIGCDTRSVGSYVFSCDVLVLRGKGNQRMDENATCKFKAAVMKIPGTKETLTVPVLGSTRMASLKKAVAEVAGVPLASVTLCSDGKAIADYESPAENMTVQGLASFRSQPYEWPHPVAIIGAGYNGLKTAMEYLREGRDCIALFDRNDRVGGHCWITAANKDSKLQTEFAAFHLWYGPEYITDPRCGGAGAWPSGWHCWAGKQEVQKMFHYGAEQYGVLPHVHFETDVSGLEVVGGKTSHDRYYKLTVDSTKKGPSAPKSFTFNASVMYCYPGSLTRHRIVEFPGESEFGGQIGYGMSDGFIYDERLRGKKVAILGNGAFAVENCRTCVEKGAEKVYLVTRRKNLASPRFPCWFVHQGPVPTPGRYVLRMFEPMYSLCGMGDPWKYWSVHASADRQNVSIIQNSRFGIGDVTFLMVAYGKLEYVEDTVQRMSKHTLHLHGGRKLEGVTGVVKSLGLLGDWAVDRLHHQTQMVGMWCDGDWRRVLAIDATGMNAANFTTFSLGIAVHSNVKTAKFMYDYPDEYYKAEKAGLLQALPVNKADEKSDKPAYVTDVKYTMSASILINAFIPMTSRLTLFDGPYKYILYHKVHPFDTFMKECIDDWNKYQTMFKEQGCTHEYIEYPYTRDMMKGYMADYNKDMGTDISIDGPSPEKAKELLDAVAADERMFNSTMFAKLATKYLHNWTQSDPSDLLQAHLAHGERAKMTSSAPESAMDFDFEHYDEWKQWASSGKCVVEDIDADHAGIRDHPMTLQKIYDLCVKKQAPMP